MKSKVQSLMTAARIGLKNVFHLADYRNNQKFTEQKLIQAIHDQDYKIIKRLILRESRVSNSSYSLGWFLHTAYRVTDGDTDIIGYFIDQGVNIKSRDSYGATLLDTAVIEGKIKVCECLLLKGLTLHAIEQNGYTTPVEKAIQYHQLPILEIFLNYFRNLHDLDKISDTLYLAVKLNKIDSIETILRFPLNREKFFDKGIPLIHFCTSSDALHALHNANLDINEPDANGFTLLSKWIAQNKEALAMALIQLEPNVFRDKEGFTSMIKTVIRNKSLPLMEALTNLELIQANTENITPSNFGDWILCYAIEEKSDLETLKFLVDYGANINGYNHANQTPLMLAALKNNPYYLLYLISLNADPNLKDGYGRTALLNAIKHRSEKCISALLGASTNLEHKDKLGFDIALHCAVSGTKKIAKTLARHKIDLLRTYSDGKTTLIYSAMSGNVEMVQTLIEAGADIDARDEHQLTALIYSSTNGHYITTAHLIKAGANVTLKDPEGKTAADRAKSSDVASLFNDNIINFQKTGNDNPDGNNSIFS